MVGFRAFAEARAARYGAAGYVRNLRTGEVEVMAEGDKSLLEEFLAELKRGPARGLCERCGGELGGAAERVRGFLGAILRGQEESMEMVAICGSPRGGGNTATLVEAALAGAREQGAKTTRFDPTKMNIADCDADGMCLESAEAGCILQDDMQQIYAALRRSQAWVFAAPVYFWNVAASLKRVIDRLYAFYTQEGGWHLGLEGKRRGAVIVVQADPEQETPKRIAEYLASVMRDLHVDVIGQLAEGSLGDPGDAAARPDLIARARELGRGLAGG